MCPHMACTGSDKNKRTRHCKLRTRGGRIARVADGEEEADAVEEDGGEEADDDDEEYVAKASDDEEEAGEEFAKFPICARLS